MGRAGNFVLGRLHETEKPKNSAVEGRTQSEQKGEELFSFVKKADKRKGQNSGRRWQSWKNKQFKIRSQIFTSTRSFWRKNPQMQKKHCTKSGLQRNKRGHHKREYHEMRGMKRPGILRQRSWRLKTKNGAVTVARKLQWSLQMENVGACL